ncbi:MAG: SDR family NAD(P)-dependent oxidoreductase [Armatimonadetes bacterium]|nr:SDR family NAD(P)-dependent oxidoreductase [Armatimonadota bacterium]
MNVWRHVIIIGATSGLGAELAKLLAAEGARVAVMGRREDKLNELAATSPDNILPFWHDVTDLESVPDLFAQATQALGGLDLLIYAAGVMPEVELDEFDTSKDALMMDTNVTGAMAWCNLAATRFQSVGKGTIVGIGSVAGDRGRRGQPGYNASKAALATYLEALRNRLDRQGVTVVTIKPGPLATEMTAHLDQSKMMPVEQAAQKCLGKMTRPGEHYLKITHRLIFAVIRLIPGAIFRRLKL